MPDRETVIKGLEFHKSRYCGNKTEDLCPYWSQEECGNALASDALALLKEQKAVTGEWIPVTNSRGGMECSICHDYAPSYQSGAEYFSKYCPNCGAKMEGR